MYLCVCMKLIILQSCKFGLFETPKNSVFSHFWKIVKLTTNVLKPSLLLEIGNGSLHFKIIPKPN